MPRTITGSYILRPTSQYGYRSSGTFTDWFYSSSAPSNWTTNMNPGTKIGDNSDSTYYSDTGVTSSNANAENAIMNMTVASGTVPSVDYTITKVTLTYRAKASTTTDASRKLNIWNTLWYSGGNKTYTPTACINAGRYGWKTAKLSTSSIATATSSIANYTSSSSTSGSMPGGAFPDMHCICVQAYKTSGWVSFSSWQLYDLWYTVEYSYTEEEVKSYVYTDSGVALSGDATIAPGSSTFGESYIEDYAGETKSLTATVQEGYDFDGWYLNGQKVSEELTYVLTIAFGVQLYCIAKKRMVYVGQARVKEIYIGTTPVGEVYAGGEVIWGPSPLYGRATAVG